MAYVFDIQLDFVLIPKSVFVFCFYSSVNILESWKSLRSYQAYEKGVIMVDSNAKKLGNIERLVIRIVNKNIVIESIENLLREKGMIPYDLEDIQDDEDILFNPTAVTITASKIAENFQVELKEGVNIVERSERVIDRV